MNFGKTARNKNPVRVIQAENSDKNSVFARQYFDSYGQKAIFFKFYVANSPAITPTINYNSMKINKINKIIFLIFYCNVVTKGADKGVIFLHYSTTLANNTAAIPAA